MECELCQPVDEKFLIYTGQNWRVELHGNQYYIGRCAIVATKHLEDLFEIDTETEHELFQIGKTLKEAEIAAFSP